MIASGISSPPESWHGCRNVRRRGIPSGFARCFCVTRKLFIKNGTAGCKAAAVQNKKLLLTQKALTQFGMPHLPQRFCGIRGLRFGGCGHLPVELYPPDGFQGGSYRINRESIYFLRKSEDVCFLLCSKWKRPLFCILISENDNYICFFYEKALIWNDGIMK